MATRSWHRTRNLSAAHDRQATPLPLSRPLSAIPDTATSPRTSQCNLILISRGRRGLLRLSRLRERPTRPGRCAASSRARRVRALTTQGHPPQSRQSRCGDTPTPALPRKRERTSLPMSRHRARHTQLPCRASRVVRPGLSPGLVSRSKKQNGAPSGAPLEFFVASSAQYPQDAQFICTGA